MWPVLNAKSKKRGFAMKELKIAVPETGKNAVNYFNVLRYLQAEPVNIYEGCSIADFDGLLLPGGGDIHPRLYGQSIDKSTGIDEKLDQRQLKIMDHFVKEKKPILGICRGHQLINVYFSGDLIQDITTAKQHKRENDVDKAHDTFVKSGSWLEEIYGSAHLVTNSAHHQAVDHMGRGLKAVQHTEDGIIEAMEHETLPIWTVQWHPERMCFAYKREDTADGSEVLRYFLKKCSMSTF